MCLCAWLRDMADVGHWSTSRQSHVTRGYNPQSCLCTVLPAIWWRLNTRDLKSYNTRRCADHTGPYPSSTEGLAPVLAPVLHKTKPLDGTKPNTDHKTNLNTNTNLIQLFYAFFEYRQMTFKLASFVRFSHIPIYATLALSLTLQLASRVEHRLK